MQAVNLLPWRLQLHQQRLRHFGYQFIAFIFLICICAICIWRFNQYQQQQLQQLNSEIGKRQTLLQNLQLENQRLQQHYQDDNEQQALANSQTIMLLQILAQLPFEQGELSTLQLWRENNQSYLQLQGFTAHQQEFEQFYQYLNAANTPFTSIKLSQFTPQANGQLLFQFDLLLKENIQTQ